MTSRGFLPIVLLLSSAACTAAELFPVTGIVVNAETGAPRPHVRVAILHTKGSDVVARQITDRDGRFHFELPEGSYILASANPGDPQMYGSRAPDAQVGSAVMAHPGQDNSHLVFRWFSLCSISGHVTDETGDPVEGALIQLIGSRVVAGRRLTYSMGWNRTDDRGDYRFGRLPGGLYYLAATGQPWYVNRFQNEGQRPVAYAGVYFPNSLDLASATPLVIKPGEDTRADFSLRTVAGAAVTVEIESAQPVNGVVGLARPGIGAASDGVQRTERIYEGESSPFQAVPPGHYLVQVSGSSGKTSMFGQVPIDVGGSDVEVKVAPKPYPTVSGTVQLKRPGMKPAGSLYVSLTLDSVGGAFSTLVRPDGTFLFPAIPPGKYRIRIAGKDGYFASEIHVDGASYVDSVAELIEGENVTVRLTTSDETGRLRGFVMNGEQAVEGAMVVLAPAVPTTDWLEYRGFQTDSDGSYDYENVPAGDYLLFAVDDVALEYTNPAVLRRYLPRARRVRVEASSGAGVPACPPLTLLSPGGPGGPPH